MAIPQSLRVQAEEELTKEVNSLCSSNYFFESIISDTSLSRNEKIKVLETFKDAISRKVKSEIKSWENYRGININETIRHIVNQFWNPVIEDNIDSLSFQHNQAIFYVFQEYRRFIKEITAKLCTIESAYSESYSKTPKDAIDITISEWSDYSVKVKRNLELLHKKLRNTEAECQKADGYWRGIEYNINDLGEIETNIVYWCDKLLEELTGVKNGELVPLEQRGLDFKGGEHWEYFIIRPKGQYDFSPFIHSFDDGIGYFQKLCKEIENANKRKSKYIDEEAYFALMQNAELVHKFEFLDTSLVRLKSNKNTFLGFSWVGSIAQLDYLFKELKDKKIIAEAKKEDFLKVFTTPSENNENSVTVPPRIVWKMNPVDLAYFIVTLIREEHIHDAETYASKIEKNLLFVNEKNEPFRTLRKHKSNIFGNKDIVPKGKTNNSGILDEIIKGLNALEKR
jgi:hypothetical protein